MNSRAPRQSQLRSRATQQRPAFVLIEWQLEALGVAGVPLLPPGRWPLTPAELHRIAVEAFPESRTRRTLWRRFGVARRALARVAREIWVGGSFLSTKENPKDIDLLAVLRSDRLLVPPQRTRTEYLTNCAHALGHACGVDLTMLFEGDYAGLGGWQRWIEAGKPWIRTTQPQARGIAVVPIADTS